MSNLLTENKSILFILDIGKRREQKTKYRRQNKNKVWLIRKYITTV